VQLLGGFAGSLAADPDARDPTIYETTLSGDQLGDDAEGFLFREDNSFHVVRTFGTNPLAVLDGFTVRGGNAHGSEASTRRGGGLHSGAQRLRIERCRFRENSAVVDGGAVYILFGVGSSFELRDCQFEDNRAFGGGGGLFLRNVAETASFVTDCRFVRNSAEGGAGGAAFVGMIRVSECDFVENSGGALFAGGNGGNGETPDNMVQFANCRILGTTAGFAAHIDGDRSAHSRLDNCYFAGNADTALFLTGSHITLTHCTIVENSGTEVGGVRIQGGWTEIHNTILWGNTAVSASGEAAQLSFTSVEPDLAHCIVMGWTGGLDAVQTSGLDPLLEELAGLDGLIGTLDDDPTPRPDSPCIDGGDTLLITADYMDIDGDGDFSEALPLDLAGHPRVLAGMASGDPAVDIGALERLFPSSIRGDCNDDEQLDIADGVYILHALFSAAAAPCYASCDFDADGLVAIGDAVLVFSYQLLGGPPPAPPHPACGVLGGALPCPESTCVP